MSEQVYALQCKKVCKSFGRNVVLNQIDLNVKKGEVHTLLGQNGAGKSTLVKIITGVYNRDSGDIVVDGKIARLDNPTDAEALGIAIIHQDHQMLPLFDVTRNAYLGMEIKNKVGKLDFKEMRRRINEKLELIQADFDADVQLRKLSVGQREQVAIISALLRNPRILILDEPTASLSAREIERLFEIIHTLKQQNVTIIYISHHLDEIFRIADRITVLRDSVVQGTLEVGEVTHQQIVTMMIGRELKEFYPKESVKLGEPLLEVKHLKQGLSVRDVSFTLHSGEILGFAGLVGAGRTETMLALYGTERHVQGDVIVGKKRYVPKSPLTARKAGFAFIPEDRRNQGIVSAMSVSENLSLAYTEQLVAHGVISRNKEKSFCRQIIKALNIVCESSLQFINELSGGNQQKVVIGRWLLGEARIFIFDQPTTGVDVGAKTEIYKQMVLLAKKGCGVIFISSENEELLGMCDNIVVMSKGQTVKDFQAAQTSEEELLYISSGGKTPDDRGAKND